MAKTSHTRAESEIASSQAMASIPPALELNDLRPISTEKLRAIKKGLLIDAIKTYGGYDQIPPKKRIRLERQSVLRGREGLHESWGSRQMLSYLSLLTNVGPGNDSLHSYKYRLERLLINDACRGAGLSPQESAQVVRAFRGDPYVLSKTFIIFIVDRKLVGEETWKSYASQWIDNIRIGLVRARRHGDLQADWNLLAPTAEVRRIFSAFGERFAGLRSTPDFTVDRRRSHTAMHVERGYESVEDFFSSRNATAFFESAPLIDRPVFWTEHIQGLWSIPYDGSRVRTFSIPDAEGNPIRLVSKRLFPMKSAFAEDEYRNSKLLYDLGFPIPEPVGIIRDRGNTYFLWRHLDVAKWNDEKSFEKECLRLEEQVNNIGVINFDWAARNFIPAYRDGQAKVHIVDCERMFIPPEVRKRLGQIVRNRGKVMNQSINGVFQ